jgi:hypothetical protein
MSYPIAEKTDNLVNRILDLEGEESARFVDLSSTTSEFIDEQTNRSTKRITEGHCRLLKKWLKSKNENREMESIEPEKLNVYLAEFFLSVRKADENLPLTDPARQYEPGTLLSMHSSFSRYLNSKQYGHNIKDSLVFNHSRQVLLAKMKELKSMGKGNRSHAAHSFTQKELEICAQQNLLGAGDKSYNFYLY